MQLLKIVIPVFMICLSSCIAVINPIVTENNIVRKDEVIGHWQTDDYEVTIEKYVGSDLYGALELAKGSENISMETQLAKMPPAYRKILMNTYLMRFHKKGVLHIMPLRFAKINNQLYAQMGAGFAIKTAKDYIIDDDETAEEIDVYPNSEDSHSIAKVDITKNSITARFINTDFIESVIKKGAIAIKFEEDPLFDVRVITASSKELESFLAKYGMDNRLYSDETTVQLQRKLTY